MTVTAIPQAPTQDGADQAERPKKGKKKIVLILVALLAIGGGGYWFFLKPAPPVSAPKPGEVVTLEPIQVNLGGAHYLRVGIALQLVEGAAKVDGSKALDATIEEFSGVAMDAVNDPTKRATYKKALEKELDHRYEGDVMGVYFTEFVTQ